MNFDDYVPVTKAELGGPAVPLPESPAPVATSPAASVPTWSAPVAAPVAVAPPRFVAGRRPLARTVDLDYPLEFNGRVFERIVVRRPSAQEVGEFFEQFVGGMGGDRTLSFPIFVDEAGEPIPAEVIQALDGVDEERIDDAAMDFLPPRLLRFRAALQSASRPSAGDNTEPTSST